MLVVMQAHATDEQVRAVCRKIESLGYRAHPMPGACAPFAARSNPWDIGLIPCRARSGPRFALRETGAK